MRHMADSFLLQCRENYFRGVTPSGPGAETEKQALLTCFHSFTGAYGTAAFSGFLQEGQYLIDLWAAHLLVEHHQPDKPTRQLCIEMIQRYANSSINLRVAQEELDWLERLAKA
jgi:hypothetical protein